MRKILNYLFLNIFVLINVCSLNACNYQTVNKYYLTENQLEEIFYNKKAAILFSNPEDLLNIEILKQTIINQINNKNFNVTVSLWDIQNNEISASSQLNFDESDSYKITIPKVIYHLSRKKDVYFTEKWHENYDIRIENKIVRYAIKVDQSMIKDISDQIYKIFFNKKNSLLTINSAEFEILDILNQSVSIVYDEKIYKKIFDKYFALTVTNLSDISQINDIHVKGLGEMDNEFIISQLDNSLFVFDKNIINDANLIQITLDLNIILNDDGVSKIIKKTKTLAI